MRAAQVFGRTSRLLFSAYVSRVILHGANYWQTPYNPNE